MVGGKKAIIPGFTREIRVAIVDKSLGDSMAISARMGSCNTVTRKTSSPTHLDFVTQRYREI